MEKISEHITLHEATFSNKAKELGIDNIPDADTISRMQTVAVLCFEQVRKWWGKPLKINSFYRCPALNVAVKGSKTSQHVKGEAIDFTGKNRVENKSLFEWCKANLIFDQLIYEYGDDSGPDWIHISFSKGNNRNQVIRIR